VTVAQVLNRLEEIKRHAHDSEFAHSLEDSLHMDLIHAIAAGNVPLDEVVEACKTASLSTTIHFKRWTS
jgi:hypothetical protein